MSAEDHFALLHDPAFVAWAEDQRAHLMPMLMDSAMTLCLVPEGPADIKFAIELGLSIMLNKPIVAVIRPGQVIPPKLHAVADHIVCWEVGSSPTALQDALAAILDKIKE